MGDAIQANLVPTIVPNAGTSRLIAEPSGNLRTEHNQS